MTTFLNKINKNRILLLLFVIFILILCKSRLAVSTVVLSSTIFFNNVFPCMFLFYTLGDLLINYDLYKVFNSSFGRILSKVFNLDSNSLLIIFLSMLLGFPSGSKYICQFLDKEYIDYDTANKLLYVTHFSNPIFILGTVSIITNTYLAVLVLISHYGSNFILLLLMRNRFHCSKSTKFTIQNTRFIDKLNESFNNTLNIIIIVLFNTIIFITLATLINSLYKNSILNLIVYMIFDLTKGIITISSIGFTSFIKGLLICILLSFGGLNIHNQVNSIIKNKKLKYSSFMKGRIFATFISLFIYIIIYIITV